MGSDGYSMTKQEMESQVAALLLEQKRLKRLGLELGPKELMLLSRLLFRLGYTKMSRKGRPILYVRLSLSKPRPAVSFGGESVNEHDLHDPTGNVVGNIRIRDRGPTLHVDWVGGKGQYAGGNLLGNEAMRSIHDAIATHYPNAQYLRGHRISGFRGAQSATGSPTVIPIRRRNKMSRSKPIRYAKFNAKTAAHPLIHGFPIEHALRHLANDPKNGKSIKNLAVAALKGHTEALWGLHDALQTPEEHSYSGEHPILKAGYKWLNAADKLHLDKHTYTALNEAAERRRAEHPHGDHRQPNGQYEWRYTPEHQAVQSALGMTSNPNSLSHLDYQHTFERVKELSPNSTDEEVNESIRRHVHRASQEAQRRLTGTSPDSSKGYAIQNPKNGQYPSVEANHNEAATRYRRKPKQYSLANKSNFIGALLKSSSPEHKLFVQRTKELAHKVGAKQTREFPALHDTPGQSVPGVAMAVYGQIQPDSAHALGSWVNGLLPNGPGYAVFHARPTGPDTLYRIRMEGSGYDARAKLDRSGINSRVFVPHKKGLDVLIPDKGNKMGQQVEQFASQQKVPVESSPGHLTTVGSQDQAQARDTFRNKVATHESKQMKRNPKQYSIKVTKPGSPVKPKQLNPPSKSFGSSMDEIYADERSAKPPTLDVAHRAKQVLSGALTTSPTSAKEVDYEPGMEPLITKLPKGIRQKDWNPTVVPPKAPKLFSTAEYSKLHAWAHKHAFEHTPAFGKFLGAKNARDPHVHNLLVKSIVQAAHEMRRSGRNSLTIGLGDTGKRLKINIGRNSWVNTKTGSKPVKLPEGAEPAPRLPLKKRPFSNPPKKKLSRYALRRMMYRRMTKCL